MQRPMKLATLTLVLSAAALADAQCEMLESGHGMRQISDELNTKCCNDGSAGGSGAGHRRALQGEEFCTLDHCTAECAETFVPLFESCPAQMQSLLNGVQGVYRFLGNCYEIQDGLAHEQDGIECGRGEEPVEDGSGCQSCSFGTFSADGESCTTCEPGHAPNNVISADGCVPCSVTSVSPDGERCTRCPSGQLADEARAYCLDPVPATAPGGRVECAEDHSFANADATFCVCEVGYYRREWSGGWSCERCSRGSEPGAEGNRCAACTYGKYSADGERCGVCEPGYEPIQATSADSCTAVK